MSSVLLLNFQLRYFVIMKLLSAFHEILSVAHAPNTSAMLSWFVREVQEDGVIKVTSIPTKSQLADFLTKPMNRPAFESNLSLTWYV